MADKETEKPAAANNSSLVVSDLEQDLAQSALSDFTKGNYLDCLETLSNLELTWTHDAKVAHNIAVAEYYRSELKKTDQFRRNLNGLRSQPIWNGEEIVKIEDVDQCVLYYNHAVILYHMKQYNLALKVIKEVFTFIEPMEESLAHKVCLLLIELLLCMRQVDSASVYLLHITTQFASTKNIQVLEKEPADKKPVAFDAATDAFRLKLLQFQTRCHLMNSYAEGSLNELKNIMAVGGVNVTTIFLRANLEYLNRNYQKAINVLNSVTGHTLPTFKDTGESVNVLYFNNMACIHHYMRKPNLACFYLQKAIKENEEAIKSFPKPDPAEPLSNRPLYTLSSNKHTELMYNLGVVLLYAGKPTQAFDCFTEAVQVYHMNPRLWLRMAECCIMAHKAGNEEDFNLHSRKNDLVQNVVGTGLHRKLILANRLSKESQYNNECQSYAIPAPTLEFASLCIRNALYILPSQEDGDINEGGESKRARISVDDNDDEEDDERESSDKRSRSSSPSTVHGIASATPMPLPLTTSSATPSPEIARSPTEQEEGDEGGDNDRESPLPENLSLPKKCSSRPPAVPHPYIPYHQQFQAFHQHQYQQHCQQEQRSPVDVLIRAFPNRRRSDVEAVLQRCKGDVLQALEIMVCSEQRVNERMDEGGIIPKSAFSPLGPPQLGQFHHRYSPQSHRRFLSAPYTGTGYLPTVIRPPTDYGLPMVGHHHDLYGTSGSGCVEKASASSPGSGTGSDKTSYSE